MALDNNTIKELLTAKFADKVSAFDEPWGLLTF
jgi:hypothetical protein